MNNVSAAELRDTLVEISAAVAVLQSEIKAVISTHPNPSALRKVFLHEVEKHTARSLALAVPDALSERIQALAQLALKDMPAVGTARETPEPEAVAD